MKNEREKIIAHIRLSKLEKNGVSDNDVEQLSEEQDLKDHLIAVSEYAGNFSKKIGLEHCGKIVGILHDIGKASAEFQTYIREAVYLGKVAKKIDHATAGARILHEFYYRQIETKEENLNKKALKLRLIEILENVILSHHSGLYAYYSLDETAVMEKRLLKAKEDMFFKEAEEYFFSHILTKEKLDSWMGKAYKEFESLYEMVKTHQEMTAGFLTKYLFSCLIDADRLDSFLFEEGKSAEEFFKRKEDNYDLWQEAHQELQQGLESLKKKGGQLNRYRSEISDIAEGRAKEVSTGILTLNIPTGAGKTLTAMRFALRHAMATGKQRIFYITNYLTVIEQNAEVIRKTLPSLNDNILEFHSNVLNDREDEGKKINEEEYSYSWQRKQDNLLQERWENPVIFTSVVQFLNTFFAGKNAYRKLHQLANSVIIFDEVQSLPVQTVILFCQAVNFLRLMNTTSISCTATQPHYQKLKDGFDIKDLNECEIIRNVADYYEAFRRNIFFVHKNKLFSDALEVSGFLDERMKDCQSLLLVTNTVKSARDTFQKIKEKEEYDCYYLSTALCPAHRKKVIKNLRQALKEAREGKASKKIICISTPLIEAGVDISFEKVVRSFAGLDSIAQTAGRCNREKEREVGEVHIIQLTKEFENINSLDEIEVKQRITKDILRAKEESEDILLPQTLEKFFEILHRRQVEKYKFPIDLKENGKKEVFKGSSIFDILNSNQVAVSAMKQSAKWINRSDIRTAEKEFYVIKQKGKQLLVWYQGEDVDGREIINALCSQRPLSEKYALLRKTQQITISVFDYVFDELCKKGMITTVEQMERVFILNEAYYSEEYGFSGLESCGDITYLGI